MTMVRLAGETDVAGWRAAARRLRLAETPPEQVQWSVGGAEGLFGGDAPPEPPPTAAFTVPRAFTDLAADALLNRAPDRFDLMYRLLWRLRGEPTLMHIATDPEVDRALGYQKSVRQAAHKMHAFLRFRRVDDPPTDATETYAAWFEPPHHVVEKATPFFVRRLANVRFTILTPEASAVWDGKAVRFGPGAPKPALPDDACEDDWATYFQSVFNPARLNPKVMTQHMAKHYWRNLPETRFIPEMVDAARGRTTAMVQAGPTTPSPRALKIAARRERDAPIDSGIAPSSLDEVAAGVQVCRRCELWRDATQGVTGEGPGHAKLMFVGEQPGDLEDLRGRPFVGPAGELLNQALEEAGVPRDQCFVTNAVKHFKHEPRGKRRLHKSPNTGEMKACRWWLENELRLVKPKVVVALGSTAAHAVLGRAVSVLKERGAAGAIEGGAKAFLTVHPSYLLRIPEAEAKRAAYRQFVDDLTAAHRLFAA